MIKRVVFKGRPVPHKIPYYQSLELLSEEIYCPNNDVSELETNVYKVLTTVISRAIGVNAEGKLCCTNCSTSPPPEESIVVGDERTTVFHYPGCYIQEAQKILESLRDWEGVCADDPTIYHKT